MVKHINIKELTIDELNGIINLYPWFSVAKYELCLRLAKMGIQESTKESFVQAALYVPSRRKISNLYRNKKSTDYSDKNVEQLIKSLIEQKHNIEEHKYTRTVHIAGGDYFSQTQYEQLRQTEELAIPKFGKNNSFENKDKISSEEIPDMFCTETLAKIYEEQGYYEIAKNLYSRLLLIYPEKNTKFASQIKRIEDLINKN